MTNTSAAMKRRRTIILLSVLSAGITAVLAMRQTGAVKHLPDPPGEFWDTDKVTTSETGYPFGVPDATVGLASIVVNVSLAALGSEERAKTMPFVPLIALGKSLADSAITLWFNSEMPRKLKAWCPYCLTASLLNLAIAALQIPEALEAINALKAD